MRKVMFISSSGGHLAELLQMKNLIHKYDSYIITEKNDSTIRLKETYKGKISFLTHISRKPFLKFIFKFIFNIIKSLIIYIKFKPEVIVTTGAGCVVPMCYIGKLMGSKIIYIESFARVETLSMTGKSIYKIADLYFVQHEELKCKFVKNIYEGGLF